MNYETPVNVNHGCWSPETRDSCASSAAAARRAGALVNRSARLHRESVSRWDNNVLPNEPKSHVRRWGAEEKCGFCNKWALKSEESKIRGPRQISLSGRQGEEGCGESLEGLSLAHKATRQCEFALAGHILSGGCSSCNHVRCTKTATSYNYQFPLDHLLLNRAYLSGRPFGKRRSDSGTIVDRRRRYAAVQSSLLRGEGLDTSGPRPSFKTRPARGTPHVVIVASLADPRQAPIAFRDTISARQEVIWCRLASQSHLVGSRSQQSPITCWAFLIFDCPGTHANAAGVVFANERPDGFFNRVGPLFGLAEHIWRADACSHPFYLQLFGICRHCRSHVVRIRVITLWQSNIMSR